MRGYRSVTTCASHLTDRRAVAVSAPDQTGGRLAVKLIRVVKRRRKVTCATAAQLFPTLDAFAGRIPGRVKFSSPAFPITSTRGPPALSPSVCDGIPRRLCDIQGASHQESTPPAAPR